MSWTSLNPTLPGGVTEAAEGLTGGLQAARTALEAVRAELRVTTALANDEVSGALTTVDSALGAALSAVEGAVNALLDDGGAYLLLVPLPKKGLVELLDGVEDLGTTAPTGAIEATVPASVRALPLWRRAFREEALFLGGNAHFLKTVGEALFDPNDDARPRFTVDTYWGCVVMIGGATDVAAGATLATYVDRIFRSRHGSNSLSASRGHTDVTVSGLRVAPSIRGGFAVIEWDAPAPRTVDGAEWRVVPTEYAVIRSERPQAMTARRVLDLFPSVALREGMTGLHGAKVIKVGRCDSITRRFVDPGPVTDNQTYYYHVALKTRMDSADRRDEFGYDILSSAARYRSEPRRNATRSGAPPDWSRSTSVARLIPSVERMLDRVTEVAKTFGSRASAGPSIARSGLDAISREIDKLAHVLDELDLTLGQLNAVFSPPSAGLHVTLRTGRGNTASLLSDLTLAFSDPTDEGRPKFDVGDEYVTGAVLVVSGPSETAFAGAWALLQSLFGEPEAEDPVLAGIRSIQTGVEAVAPSLTPVAPSVTFNDDMTPRQPGQGDASCET